MPRSVRRLCGCILAATVLLLPACASREERLAEHIKRGEHHAAEGRIPDALLEYQSALELDPRDAELYQRIGDLLARGREYKDAISYYRQAFELDPERIGAAMSEARLLAFGDPKRARELVQIGLDRWPDRSDVQLTRAHVALASGDLEQAQVAAQRAVELEPESSAAWAQLAKVHQARIRKHQLAGKIAPPEVFQAALAAFARVDQIEKGDAHALVERARILAAWGGHGEEALATHRAAIATAKRRGDAAGLRVAANAFDEFAKLQDDNALRREALREIVDADPADYAAWDRLVRLADGQPVPRGEAICQELLAKRPDDPRTHRLYTSYLLRKHRTADAVAHLRRVIDAGGKAPQLWEQLVTIQIRANQLVEAHATHRELVKAFPDDPVTRGVEARLALADGRVDDAVRILRELVKTHETSEYQRMLAVAEQRRGADLPAAIAAIDRAIALDPDSVDYYRLKASIHYDAKEWGKTILAYRVITAIGRHLSANEELRRARALYEFGDANAGRAALEQILAQPNAPPDAAIEFAHREGSGAFDAARTALLAAQQRAPGDPRVLEALVQLEVAAGESELALLQVETEIAAGRVRPRTLLLHAQLVAANGELARAEAEVLRAFEAAPTLPGAAELLFDIYRRQGRLAEARRSFEQAQAAGLLHPGTRLLLSRLYLSQGDFAQALPVLEQVVAEQPELASARNDLAYVLASLGQQLERAIALAQSAQKSLGDNAAAIDTLGYVYYRAGRLEAALTELERAIALAGSQPGGVSPTYTYHLGLVLEALGRKPEAASAFERALASTDEFPEAEDARRHLASVQGTASPDANAS